jgi:ribosomal protein S18 acetylase RimI-like enzyme
MSLTIRPYVAEDQEAVIALWETCQLVVPQNDPIADIQNKIQFQPDLFLVAIAEGRLVGTVMAGYEGHRGWINYLAVAPAQRRRGIARTMMARAEKKLRALGCPKINLQVRRTNTAVIDFYQAIGFDEDDVVSLGKDWGDKKSRA